MPVFPGGELPAPEPASRRNLIHGAAVLALAVSVGYLVWRGLFTISLASWWVSIPFYVLEIHAVVGLALFAFALWDLDAGPSWRRVQHTNKRIAVLIPTYNEDREILLPTIAAAVALEPNHETWVLDDGGRVWVRGLAKELGARYIARNERIHAKAGNINHALGIIDADFVAVLDADHVAAPDLLRNTLGYFDDPAVAIVQTPQDFYNLDSFEHGAAVDNQDGAEPYHEQQLFYRAIQPGKNRCHAVFWCGTGAILRTAALADVGGVATGTVTEDIHTTIRLHRRGWKTVYHNEVLARGLAASTAEQFQQQRLRWGTGAMQVLKADNPLTCSGLRLTQRIAYAATLFGWFDSWRSLGYLLIPIVVLLTGGLPVEASFWVFAPVFCLTFASQHTALRLLSRGHHRLVLPLIFDLVRMTPNLRATIGLVSSATRRFQVTHKGREEDERTRIEPPLLLLALIALSVVASVWFLLTIAGVTGAEYLDLWFAFGAFFWLAVNFGLLLSAIGRIWSQQYAPERRSSVRFATGLAATLDGMPCAVKELSLTGAQIEIAGDRSEYDADESRRRGLTIGMLGKALGFGVLIRWSQRQPRSTLVGVEFLPGQTRRQASLALAMLNGELLLVTAGPARLAA